MRKPNKILSNRKNNRFWSSEKIISLAAILISAGTLFTISYQNLLIRQQQYASARPHLTIKASNNKERNSFELHLTNNGIGPAFRRERPQKGRYRQFNQINFEILGTYDVLADVELITLASKILEKLLPSKKINLQINSLGNKETLNVFKSDLGKYLKKYEDKFTEEIRKKIFSNPLRILDSKDLEIDDILNNAPIISDYYSKETKNKFNDLQQLLKDSSINYTINSNLVRGLDYYCHTVFEFKTEDLGSQDTLIGGGRYDGLIKLLGGTDLPGVGWAGGIERIIMLSENFNLQKKNIFLIIMDEIYKNYGFKIATILRKNNLRVHFDYKYNLKKSLSNASKQNFELAIIIGENEVKNNLCTIKYLDKNIQKTVEVKNIISELIR